MRVSVRVMELFKAMSLFGVLLQTASALVHTTLGTYNAGLFGAVGNADARVSVVVDHVRGEQSHSFCCLLLYMIVGTERCRHFLCLQEVWTADIPRKIHRD